MIPSLFAGLKSLAGSLSGDWNRALLGRPLYLIGRHGLKAKRMFLGMPRRQAVTIYAGALWTVCLCMAAPYLSLYMVQLGLSETEVGLYQFLMKAVGLVGFFLGGYFSDVWGRKRALVTFDIFTWCGYCLCLALADSKAWCVAAIFFIATNALSLPPYQCLLAENLSAKQRGSVYAVMQLVNLAPFLLFFPLLGGLWVEKAGLMRACHGMYWLFFFCVSLGIALRWRLLPPSEVYEKPPGDWLRLLQEGLGQYAQTLRKYLGKPGWVLFLSSRLIDEWFIATWAIYASLYYARYLGLRDSYLSILTQGSAYVAFVILFVLMPNLSERFLVRILGFDQLFGVAAMALLLWVSPGEPGLLTLCLLAASLAAVGGSLYASVSTAVWMSIIDEKERAKVVAASTAFIYIGVLVAGSLSSFLYGHVSPPALLAVILGLRLVGFILLRRVSAILAPPAPSAPSR
ncbi:MAG TPA: MFS transporter [bacterium]|nr:MFS transporter [bacterium]